ncbi:hypothetical protein BJV82DRAFT_573141 [Fennellomyces sp. T-0311]|nr:hypothetical protein BJV82DRAFT_573141 [Fennellomyces sp. T-0311]
MGKRLDSSWIAKMLPRLVHVSPGQETEADHIRLQFHAVESVQAIEISPGVLRTQKPYTLFGVQQTLWKDQPLESSTLTLPFTIQMPVVNYPPSVKHEYYQCTFKLTAFLEHSSQVLRSTEKLVYYRPFIETCLLKKPIRAPDGQLELHALEFIPGDTIPVTIFMDSDSSKRRIVTAKLYRTVRLNCFRDIPKLTELIVSQQWDEGDLGERMERELEISLLRIPLDMIPSFSYSSVFSISYQLKVSVKYKQFGGLWSSGREFQFPVTIGTLSYGVYGPSQLRIYSTLSTEEQRQQVPLFMRAAEHSDTLPPYDSTRLPTYQNAVAL